MASTQQLKRGGETSGNKLGSPRRHKRQRSEVFNVVSFVDILVGIITEKELKEMSQPERIARKIRKKLELMKEASRKGSVEWTNTDCSFESVLEKFFEEVSDDDLVKYLIEEKKALIQHKRSWGLNHELFLKLPPVEDVPDVGLLAAPIQNKRKQRVVFNGTLTAAEINNQEE